MRSIGIRSYARQSVGFGDDCRSYARQSVGFGGTSPRSGDRSYPLCLGLLLVVILAARATAADQPRTATVGMPDEMEQLILPGSELEAKPIEDRNQPIVLRIVDAFPHGTAYRYDLVYYGLEPGEYDLKDYLRRLDGSSMDDVPSLPVEIQPVLPPGQVEPTPLEPGATPRVGGYRNLLCLGGVAWVIGLGIILFAGRKGKSNAWRRTPPPMTLAERLHQALDKATAGELDQSELAELERMLLAYWRRKLDLQDIDAAEAVTRLREHEEAGPLLKQLEHWLHDPDTSTEVDVATLLEPYRNVADVIPRSA